WPFEPVYAVAAWLCWLVPLAVVTAWIIHEQSRRRPCEISPAMDGHPHDQVRSRVPFAHTPSRATIASVQPAQNGGFGQGNRHGPRPPRSRARGLRPLDPAARGRAGADGQEAQ